MPCRTRLVSGRIFKLSEDTAASHLERPAPTEFEIGQEMMGTILMFFGMFRDVQGVYRSMSNESMLHVIMVFD